jgi:ATP-dependent DNA ligase
MKPLLAHTYEPHRISYPCYVQPKLNGIRALYQNGRFQSRDGIPFSAGLLDHIAKPLLGLFSHETILDGELYVHGWPLQRINGAVTPVRQTPIEDTLQVQYHIFDKVNYNLPFIERYEAVYTTPAVAFGVETKLVNSAAEADALYAYWVAAGYEGMMYRLGDCPYTVPKQEFNKQDFGRWTERFHHSNPRSRFLSDKDNRAWHLIKRKDWQDDEFKCFGVIEGEGKYAGSLGALQCYATGQAKHYKEAGPFTTMETLLPFSVGSGLTDSERNHYWQNPPINRLIKVKYLCLSSDGIPLNPTILTIL